MSFHKADWEARGNWVLTFFKDHPAFTTYLLGFLSGSIVTRLVHG